MTTVAEIINLALTDSGVLGVGQTAQAQDTADALTRLNFMIGQWNRERWLVYHLVDVSCAMTGAASYGLGTGQPLNVPRLDRIDAAYVRDALGVDTSMRMMRSREEFARIREKADTGSGYYAFYDSDNPTGQVYIWPIPPTGNTLHILGKAVLQSFSATSDTITLPLEYNQALYANLVVMLRAAYRLPPDDYYSQLATTTLAVIQKANLQDSDLRMPKVAGRSVGDLINLALEDSGAFSSQKPPSYQDTLDALWRINMTIGQWNRRRWLVYHLLDVGVQCSAAVSYTVGPGGDFDIVRPDRLEAAYIRQLVPSNPSPVDWPLRIIQSREEYSQITLKNLTAAPSEAVFYDSGFPLGAVYPWPVPNSQYQLHLLVKSVLSQFDNLEDVVNLPPEYEQAIYAQIKVQARSAYQLPADQVMIGEAKATLSTLRKANFQVGRMTMPTSLQQGRAYNVYSDQGG